ncbi:MAG TPA: response regulator, partial [Pseudomonas sp.]|nr:response regulator [Pseudomonas sp.]
HLRLHSQPGQGACFEVLFPGMDGQHAVSPTRAEGSEAPSGGLCGRVGVVDDDPLVGEYLEDCLRHWGLAVTVWNDAEQACAVLLATPRAWDALILDQSMPRLSGLALAEQVLALHPQLPIALHTGFSDPGDESAARRLGISLLHKPLDAAALHQWLNSHLPG